MAQTAPFHILVNTQSGTFREVGREGFASLVDKSGLPVRDIGYFTPDEMASILKQHENIDDPVMVAGGDGTICALAAQMLGKDKPFAFLPMGTMNLLAHDLDMARGLEDVLKAYARGTRRVDVDVGVVNDHIFMCCAGLMVLPAASEYREKNRSQSDPVLIPRLTLFVLEQMDRTHSRVFDLIMDGQRRKVRSAALVISNNQYQPDRKTDDNNFRRHSLTDGTLGVYTAAPAGIWRKLAFMLRLRFGDWRHDPSIRAWEAGSLTIHSEQKTEDVSLDGETITLTTPLEFTIRKQGLPLLVPEAA